MKEYFNYERMPKHNSKVEINEHVMIGGYEYTKTNDTTYENSSSIIIIQTNLSQPYAIFSYKKGVKKGKTYNQFGQSLR